MKNVSNSAIASTIAAALVASATLFGATAANAQAGAYYVATPVAAPAKPLITRSTSWQVQGASLVAAQAPERPAILCQLVADRAGPLAGFSVAGKPVDADALTKCNAKVAGRQVSVAAK